MDLEKEAIRGIELNRKHAIAITKYLKRGEGDKSHLFVMPIERVGALMLYIKLDDGETINCDYHYQNTDRRYFFDVKTLYIDAVGNIVSAELRGSDDV